MIPTNPKTNHQLKRDVITLNGEMVSIQSGQNYTFASTTDRTSTLYLNWIETENKLHQSLFSIFTDLLSTHSISYACKTSYCMGAWLKKIEKTDTLETQHLLQENIPYSYYSFIIPALRRIARQYLPGLSDDLIDYLDRGYKREQQGDGTYFILLTNDPERGALTDQELHNLHGALNSAYANGLVNVTEFTLAWTFIATGLRSIQVARLSVGDVQINPGPEGFEVNLKIPLAKGAKTSLQEFWPRRAPSVLAECLIQYLKMPDVSEKNPEEKLFEGNSDKLSRQLSSIFTKLNTWSERLEAPIPITPYRFRYTLATRAIRQGASDFEVARLLTHRTTFHIQFYRASMPELQKPIRTHIGKEMDYFARAFQGKLINDLSEATRKDEGEALILDFMHLTGQAVGACGTHAKCHQNAPIACLACSLFEPFKNAPWEDLLNKIKNDQAMEKEERIRMINHNAMSSIMDIIALRDGAITVEFKEEI